MNSKVRRARVTSFATITFTGAEKRRIEKAAKICGWQTGEGAAFGRQLLLRNVASILASAKARRAKAAERRRLSRW
jgi:hypothetical protein